MRSLFAWFRSWLLRLGVLFCAVALSTILLGCEGRVEVIGNLDGERAVDAVVALYRAGISAERQKVSSGRTETYSISVPAQDVAKAEELIHELRLLEQRSVPFEEFTKPSGFTPNSPLISKLRAEHAQSLRLERILSALPGVVVARVNVNSKGGPLAADDWQIQGVSVVVRYVSRSKNIPFSTSEVQQTILQTWPSLDPSAVQINASRVVLPDGGELFGQAGEENGGTIVPLVRRWPFVFRLPQEDLGAAIKQIVFYMLAFCFAGIVLGIWWGMVRAKKKYNLARRQSNSSEMKGRIAAEASTGSSTGSSTGIITGKTATGLQEVDSTASRKRKKLGTGGVPN